MLEPATLNLLLAVAYQVAAVLAFVYLVALLFFRAFRRPNR
jgi:hypothetical protein